MSALTRLPVTMVNGNVGSGADAQALAAPINIGARNFLQIQNTHATQTLSYTIDGSTAAAATAFLLQANGGSATYDNFVPQGQVRVIGSGASTTWVIAYA